MFRVKRSILTLLVTCSAIVLLMGCNSEGEKNKEEGAATHEEKQTKVVKDKLGEVEIPMKPERIADVSGSTEELLALGFTPVISGNTDMSNPKEFSPTIKDKLGKDVQNAGWYHSEVNIETIAATKPDLILAGKMHEKLYDQLQKIAPTVLVPYYYDSFRDRFDYVATILNKQDEMNKWMDDYDKKAAEVAEKVKQQTKQETFAVIEATPKDIRLYVRSGIADIIYDEMKLPKVAGLPEPDPWGGKVTSVEALDSIDPDHIILMANEGENVLDNNKVWESLKAVKAGHVYEMTSDDNYNYSFTAFGRQQLIERIDGWFAK